MESRNIYQDLEKLCGLIKVQNSADEIKIYYRKREDIVCKGIYYRPDGTSYSRVVYRNQKGRYKKCND